MGYLIPLIALSNMIQSMISLHFLERKLILIILLWSWCFGERWVCIYTGRQDGRVMKINTNNGSHCVVGHSVDPGQYSNSDIILGIDGCIYWPPVKSRRIRKYDPQLIKLRSSETTLQAYNGNGMEDIWHSMGSSIVCRTMKIGFFLLIQRRNMYRP